MSKTLELTCGWCNQKYVAQRKSSKFCSTACRVASSRYDPVAIGKEINSIIGYNLQKLHELAVKHPELSPEIDAMFQGHDKLIMFFRKGDNYKRVIDEQNRRLI